MKRYKYFYLVPAMALLCCNTSCELDQLPEGGTMTTEQKDQIQSNDPAKLNADVVGMSSALWSHFGMGGTDLALRLWVCICLYDAGCQWDGYAF